MVDAAADNGWQCLMNRVVSLNDCVTSTYLANFMTVLAVANWLPKSSALYEAQSLTNVIDAHKHGFA